MPAGHPILTSIIALFIVLVAWIAFQQIKVKRMQENVPTSKSAGVVFGLAEVKGQLLAPATQIPCSWYRYIV
jgi:1-acyl-sn-glycerol-3-phosphate acyltransferase